MGSKWIRDGEFKFPTSIEIDKNDNVFIADTGNDRVQKFDKNGNHLTTIGISGTGEGEFTIPTGLCFDSHGQLYVRDDTVRIQIFTTELKYQKYFMVEQNNENKNKKLFKSNLTKISSKGIISFFQNLFKKYNQLTCTDGYFF